MLSSFTPSPHELSWLAPQMVVQQELQKANNPANSIVSLQKLSAL